MSTNNNENSVMMALADLCQMEDERVVKEAAKRAAEQAKREEARRREELERKRQQAEDEALVKERLAAELHERDAQAQARIASLRAELTAVQASREAVQVELLARQNQPVSPRRTRSMLGLASMLTALVAVAVGVASIARSTDNRPVATDYVTPSYDLDSVASQEDESSFESESQKLETQPKADKTEAVATLEDTVVPAAKNKVNRKPKRQVKPKPKPRPDDDLDALSTCGNDPLCGMGSSLVR